MIKVEKVKVFNFEGAIRGMRNPLNSWDKSDSVADFPECFSCPHENTPKCQLSQPERFVIGERDLDLMQRLYRGGTEHRKYLRQIFVSMDIVSPLYWWKEFDTYKVGTTANSCSTMHRIHAKEFTLDDFSHEHLDNTLTLQLGENNEGLGIYITSKSLLEITIGVLNELRKKFNETQNKDYWYSIIQLLPASYNQRRTVTMNYENVMNIINQREHHKLDCWVEFVKILKELPYMKEIRGEV